MGRASRTYPSYVEQYVWKLEHFHGHKACSQSNRLLTDLYIVFAVLLVLSWFQPLLDDLVLRSTPHPKPIIMIDCTLDEQTELKIQNWLP